MNAPAIPATLAKPADEVLPLASIVPSKTHIQELRRARFDPKLLEDLAASIRAIGILQPIVVRPAGLNGAYELVAGERRWLAAKKAGLTDIRASVCVLSPEQVLEVQLVENLQREGLHELEEAEGYEELMKLKKINADAVADMVGKSRSYVYARTKLLALCPEARKAFYAGELDASKALLVARIGHHDTQRQALKDITHTDNWRGGSMSYREAHQHVLQNYMLKLKGAPFAIDDATLLPKAGTCTACPKRTGNQKDLFADVKDVDICTDPKCFADKRVAHFERKRQAAEKAGKKVIDGKDAAEIFPNKYDADRVAGGYTSLDARCYDDPKQRPVREILAKNPELIDLVQHPQTKELVEVARSSAVTEVLNERGIKTHRQRVAEQTAKARKSSTADKQEEALTEAIAHQQAIAIFKAAPARISKPMLLQVFGNMLEDYNFEAGLDLAVVLGLPGNDDGLSQIAKKLTTLNEADLTRAFVATLVLAARYSYDGRQKKEALGWIKVDLKKIEAQVRAEAKKIPGGEAGFKVSKGLAAIVGPAPLAKADILKQVEDYITKHKLREKKEIKLDAMLKAALGKQIARIGAFELASMVEQQLTLAVSATKYDKPAKKAKRK